jgi:hypothetical protein
MAETTLSISAGALTIPELVDERIDTQLTRLISTLSVLDLAAQNSVLKTCMLSGRPRVQLPPGFPNKRRLRAAFLVWPGF